MRCAYLLIVESEDVILHKDYKSVAAEMVSAYRSALHDHSSLADMVKGAIKQAHIEVDVANRDEACDSVVVAKAIVMFEADKRVGFDKGLFAQKVKQSMSVPVKVFKRAMPSEDFDSMPETEVA